MRTISIQASAAYNILIENGVLDRIGALSRPVTGDVRAAVISDDTVFSLYGERVLSSLSAAGYWNTRTFVVPHGEESKNLETFGRLLNFLAEEGYTRSDVIFALGGGVVGDLAGFAAACYLRGIRFIQIPTTLLAAVDSSVGGKTGVDLDAGKNLAGAFHQPSLVLCDPETLGTLPPEIFACGMAEVIKYGMINDRVLFDLLTPPADPKAHMEEIIERCVRDKGEIVAKDEFDTGLRQLLNLGHTIGHGVEALSHFKILHGEAVAIGMAIVTRAAAAMDLCPPEDRDALLAMLQYYHLPITTDFPAEDLYRKSLSDKKRKGGAITLVIPYGIADSRLYPCPMETVRRFITMGLR